jgi:hypothetical protein
VVTDRATPEDSERLRALVGELGVAGYVIGRVDRRLLSAYTATAPRWLRDRQPHLFQELEGGPILWQGGYDDGCGLVIDDADGGALIL